jgi:electron transport complex protein RnfD
MEPTKRTLHRRSGTPRRYPTLEAPFIRSPEQARTVFGVMLAAACVPLLAGIVLFGVRAAYVAAICVVSCVLIERLYYKLSKMPALLGRTHAYLTGVLLALTLPAFTPWYVALTASACAIILGKTLFGGVGHFLWQPALLGRLAVSVIFAQAGLGRYLPHETRLDPETWPVLAPAKLLVGDVSKSEVVESYRQWRGNELHDGKDAILVRPLCRTLEGLTSSSEPQFSAIFLPPGFESLSSETAPSDKMMDHPKPGLMSVLPPITDFLYGTRPGAIGETCIIAILLAGLYLIYRNYVKWQLPLAILATAYAVAAIAPISLAGPNDSVSTVWFPLWSEGLDVGFTYVNYQIMSGGLVLAAFFLATEMTSRPVTSGGQIVFGIGCGALAMGLQLYTTIGIAAFMAVLAMNTLTPAIDALWRPRVFGRRRFESLRR